MTKKQLTLQEHLRNAAKARWASKTPQERAAHAKMMVDRREAGRAAKRASKAQPEPQPDGPQTIPESD